jgi:hypothetical protein
MVKVLRPRYHRRLPSCQMLTSPPQPLHGHSRLEVLDSIALSSELVPARTNPEFPERPAGRASLCHSRGSRVQHIFRALTLHCLLSLVLYRVLGKSLSPPHWMSESFPRGYLFPPRASFHPGKPGIPGTTHSGREVPAVTVVTAGHSSFFASRTCLPCQFFSRPAIRGIHSLATVSAAVLSLRPVVPRRPSRWSGP